MVWELGIGVLCLGFFPFFTGEMLLEASTATNLQQPRPTTSPLSGVKSPFAGP